MWERFVAAADETVEFRLPITQFLHVRDFFARASSSFLDGPFWNL